MPPPASFGLQRAGRFQVSAQPPAKKTAGQIKKETRVSYEVSGHRAQGFKQDILYFLKSAICNPKSRQSQIRNCKSYCASSANSAALCLASSARSAADLASEKDSSVSFFSRSIFLRNCFLFCLVELSRLMYSLL